MAETDGTREAGVVRQGRWKCDRFTQNRGAGTWNAARQLFRRAVACVTLRRIDATVRQCDRGRAVSDSGTFCVTRAFDHPVFAPDPFTEREAWLWLIAALLTGE
jgi:hypothetical protein